MGGKRLKFPARQKFKPADKKVEMEEKPVSEEEKKKREEVLKSLGIDLRKVKG